MRDDKVVAKVSSSIEQIIGKTTHFHYDDKAEGFAAVTISPVENMQADVEDRKKWKVEQGKDMALEESKEFELVPPVEEVEQVPEESKEFELVPPVEEVELVRPVDEVELVRPVDEVQLVRPVDEVELVRPA